MKKAVVLLITLLFIMSISAIILKNMDSTEKFLDEVAINSSLTQLKITNKNIQDEVVNFLYKYKDDEEAIEKIIEVTSLGVPFSVKDIEIFLRLDYYFLDTTACNLNTIKNLDQLNISCENIASTIQYPYDFITLLNRYKKDYKTFKTKEQIDYFLNDYKKLTKDRYIDDIKNSFSYFTIKEESESYFKVDYQITLKNTTSRGYFIFDNDTKKIIDSNIALN